MASGDRPGSVGGKVLGSRAAAPYVILSEREERKEVVVGVTRGERAEGGGGVC